MSIKRHSWRPIVSQCKKSLQSPLLLEGGDLLLVDEDRERGVGLGELFCDDECGESRAFKVGMQGGQPLFIGVVAIEGGAAFLAELRVESGMMVL